MSCHSDKTPPSTKSPALIDAGALNPPRPLLLSSLRSDLPLLRLKLLPPPPPVFFLEEFDLRLPPAMFKLAVKGRERNGTSTEFSDLIDRSIWGLMTSGPPKDLLLLLLLRVVSCRGGYGRIWAVGDRRGPQGDACTATMRCGLFPLRGEYAKNQCPSPVALAWIRIRVHDPKQIIVLIIT